jgi:hypothetical protein
MLAKLVLAVLVGALAGMLAATDGTLSWGAAGAPNTYSSKSTGLIDIAWHLRHHGE